jgi:hypothetical protein
VLITRSKWKWNVNDTVKLRHQVFRNTWWWPFRVETFSVVKWKLNKYLRRLWKIKLLIILNMPNTGKDDHDNGAFQCPEGLSAVSYTLWHVTWQPEELVHCMVTTGKQQMATGFCSNNYKHNNYYWNYWKQCFVLGLTWGSITRTSKGKSELPSWLSCSRD